MNKTKKEIRQSITEKNQKIAGDLDMWLEFVCGNDDRELNTQDFNEKTFEERLNHIEGMWPLEIRVSEEFYYQ